MKKKRPIVIANWKMNPGTLQAARKLFDGIKKRVTKIQGVDVVIAPPAVFLPDIRTRYRGSKIALGVQNIGSQSGGAYTGEVSGEMVRSAGATYAIIGHSERRAMGETNDLVSQKTRLAIQAGLTPIVCVGERERSGEGAYLEIIQGQINAIAKGLSPKEAHELIIAYEPVWAIGKKAEDAMRPHELYETVLFIRKTLMAHVGKDTAFMIPIVYGGSVEAGNIHALSKEGNVNGFLVGHASLNPDEFLRIVEAVELLV